MDYFHVLLARIINVVTSQCTAIGHKGSEATHAESNTSMYSLYAWCYLYTKLQVTQTLYELE